MPSERLERGDVVRDAVEAGGARVRAHERGLALARELHLGAPLAQQDPLLRHALAVAVADDERHRPDRLVPLSRARLREEAALLERELPAFADDRTSGKPGFRSTRSRARGPALGRLRERRPEIIGDGVPLRVAPHVEPDPVAEALLAEVALDHPEHRPALLVRDEVERLARRVHVADLGVDRVRGAQRVEVHRRRLALVEVEPDAPGGVPLVDDLVGHPGGERLVEPQIVPPRHRHPVPEPLVRELVRHDLRDALLLGERGGLRVEQERDLPVGDEPGVLHRARLELGEPDLIDLAERIGHTEVVLEPRQHLDGDVLAEAGERKLRRRPGRTGTPLTFTSGKPSMGPTTSATR